MPEYLRPRRDAAQPRQPRPADRTSCGTLLLRRFSGSLFCWPSTAPVPGQWRTVPWDRRAELWANPARPKETAPASGTSSGGSFTSDGSSSLERWGEPALFVGHTYLAVMSHTTIGVVGPRGWSTLVMLPFDDGLIGDGEEYRGWDGQQATLDKVWGLTGPQFKRLLTSTPIDPAVARYAARDKYQLSRRDR